MKNIKKIIFLLTLLMSFFSINKTLADETLLVPNFASSNMNTLCSSVNNCIYLSGNNAYNYQGLLLNSGVSSGFGYFIDKDNDLIYLYYLYLKSEGGSPTKYSRRISIYIYGNSTLVYSNPSGLLLSNISSNVAGSTVNFYTSINSNGNLVINTEANLSFVQTYKSLEFLYNDVLITDITTPVGCFSSYFHFPKKIILGGLIYSSSGNIIKKCDGVSYSDFFTGFPYGITQFSLHKDDVKYYLSVITNDVNAYNLYGKYIFTYSVPLSLGSGTFENHNFLFGYNNSTKDFLYSDFSSYSGNILNYSPLRAIGYDLVLNKYYITYVKSDGGLYSNIIYFTSGLGGTCTENNDNCTCISYTPQTYENQLKYDYSLYGKSPNDYIISNSDSSYFRFRKTSVPNNTLDFTFGDFNTKNFYNSGGLAIFDDNEKYISFIDGGINLNNGYFKKRELSIKNYSGSINFIQLNSLDNYDFNLYGINKVGEKVLIGNFQTNTPNYLENTYFNLFIEFDGYQFGGYSIKDIILKQYERVYGEDQLICYNSENKNFTIDGEDTDYTIIDNLDPNIIKDIIDGNTQSVFKDKIFNEIKSSINSQSLGNLDVSGSGIINSTIGTSLNNIQSGDFGVGSCRMFGDNLQFLYYSNGQISPNVNFGDFDNMFLDGLSFVGEKMIGVLIAPLNNMFSLVTIITPFGSSNKDYCLFGNVVTYQPHKLFIGTEYHNKMLLIDYFILFAYGLFLGGTLMMMNGVAIFALGEKPQTTFTTTTENKNINGKIIRSSSNKMTTKTKK